MKKSKNIKMKLDLRLICLYSVNFITGCECCFTFLLVQPLLLLWKRVVII